MTPPPALPTLPDGFRLQGYIIDRTLAQMADRAVYLAYGAEDDEQVLIEEFLPCGFASRNARDMQVGPVDDSPEAREAFDAALGGFFRESCMVAALKHPNIVRVQQTFPALGTVYAVQAYAGQVSLQEFIAEDITPGKEGLQHLLSSLLPALEYLHGQGILHCGITPAAIRIHDDATPVLDGFRHVCTMQDAADSAGRNSGGTPGPWTDLYALGATLYHLLTGTRPADAADSTPTPPLADDPDLVEEYGKPLLAGIDKAMAAAPAQRWQSAADWLHSLG